MIMILIIISIIIIVMIIMILIIVIITGSCGWGTLQAEHRREIPPRPSFKTGITPQKRHQNGKKNPDKAPHMYSLYLCPPAYGTTKTGKTPQKSRGNPLKKFRLRGRGAEVESMDGVDPSFPPEVQRAPQAHGLLLGV